MANNFDELRAKVPPESLAKVDARVERTLDLMAAHEVRRTQRSALVRPVADGAGQHELHNNGKLDWLRTAAAESFSSIDRGEGLVFESMDDVARFVEEIG